MICAIELCGSVSSMIIGEIILKSPHCDPLHLSDLDLMTPCHTGTIS